MEARHLLSLAELGPDNLNLIINNGMAIAEGRWKPRQNGSKVVGIFFRKPSTRTRTSFTVAAMKLHTDVITYGPNDLQLSTGETLEDTARVLSGFLDALVIRTNESVAEMQTLAAQSKMSVVNAMSDNEHPTQAIADLLTIYEATGRLSDIHILYLGEGNNSAAALALAVSLTPRMRLTLVTPEGYGLPQDVLTMAEQLGSHVQSIVEQHHSMDNLPKEVDVVYTTRWQTMGVAKADSDWYQKFEPYSVTPEVMERVSKPTTIFLHDLPAVRGAEVFDEVLDGPQSRAFRQSEHKLTAAMAVLDWCLYGA
jgi:ornithine carbamoyltransferase